MGETKCCYIYDSEPDEDSISAKAGIGRDCPNLARWVIHHPPDPYDITYSCSIHIGDLFDETGRRACSYWPIEWDSLADPQH